MDRIRIGTRGSKLALKQASLVQTALLRAADKTETEIIILHTRGDKIQDKPLAQIGEKGVFASELEQALLDGKIDAAVHSAKDLPMALADGLEISAVLPRADVQDVLVIPKGGSLPELAEWQKGPENRENRENSEKAFKIGSGSRRRQLLAEQFWRNVVCENIRGNVDTRLRKLKEGGFDGILLAKAGLDRLGIGAETEEEFTFFPLPPEQFLPAACQGMIAVETVRGSETERICQKIKDAETMLCFEIEREVLGHLAADCSEAAAVWCRFDGSRLILDAMYAGRKIRLTGKAEIQEGRKLAAQAADVLKENGIT